MQEGSKLAAGAAPHSLAGLLAGAGLTKVTRGRREKQTGWVQPATNQAQEGTHLPPDRALAETKQERRGGRSKSARQFRPAMLCAVPFECHAACSLVVGAAEPWLAWLRAGWRWLACGRYRTASRQTVGKL